MSVHFRTGRMGVDLHEHLSNHLSPQPFTYAGQLPSCLRGATLAAQTDVRTKSGVIVVGGGNHVVNIMPLTLTVAKGFEEGFGYLDCGDAYPHLSRTANCRTPTSLGHNCITGAQPGASL